MGVDNVGAQIHDLSEPCWAQKNLYMQNVIIVTGGANSGGGDLFCVGHGLPQGADRKGYRDAGGIESGGQFYVRGERSAPNSGRVDQFPRLQGPPVSISARRQEIYH